MVSLATLRAVPTRKNVNPSNIPVSIELVERRIYLIRRHKVMLDVDLAELYEVPTKRFNQQVRRNLKRFPEDFMFQLTKEEAASLRSQFATSKKAPGALRSQFAISKTSQEGLRSQIATSKAGRGGRRYLPFALTEQGVAMLSTVLNSVPQGPASSCAARRCLRNGTIPNWKSGCIVRACFKADS